MKSSPQKRMEVAAGLEPAKTGFADRRLDHFGIATMPLKSHQKTVGGLCRVKRTLYPHVYPKLYPNCPENAYLPQISPF